jgi:hypothetical protein
MANPKALYLDELPKSPFLAQALLNELLVSTIGFHFKRRL